MSTEWVDVQRRTFTAWVNTRLEPRELRVEELEEDLRDGVRLIHLLEVLSERSLGRFNRKPRLKLHSYENLNAALGFLKREGIHVVNIGAQDIEGANPKICLGLIWTLILHYQLAHGGQGAGQGAAGGQGGAAGASGAGNPAAQRLLEFARECAAPHGIEVANLTSSFADGRALSAVAHRLQPDAVDMAALSGDPVADHEAAMVAAEALGVPRVLEPADVGKDKHSMLLYLSYLHAQHLQRSAEPAPAAPAADAAGAARLTGLDALAAGARALEPVRLGLEGLPDGEAEVRLACDGAVAACGLTLVALEAGTHAVTGVTVNGEPLGAAAAFPVEFVAGPAAPTAEGLLDDASPCLAWLLDADLAVRRASGAALRLSGQSEAEVVGRHFVDDLVDEARGAAAAREALEGAARGEQARQAPAVMGLRAAPAAGLMLLSATPLDPRRPEAGLLAVAQPLDAAGHRGCRRCCTLLLGPDGRVTWASDGAAVLFGPNAEGRHFGDELVAAPSRAAVEARLAAGADAGDGDSDGDGDGDGDDDETDIVVLCRGEDSSEPPLEADAVLQAVEPLAGGGCAVLLADVDDAVRRARAALEQQHEYEVDAARNDAEAAAAAERDALQRQLDEERARRKRAEHELEALRESGSSAEGALLERVRAADQRHEAVQARLRDVQDEVRFLEDKAAQLERQVQDERARSLKAESDLEEHLNAAANADRAPGAPVVGRWDGVDGRTFRYGFDQRAAAAGAGGPRQSVWEHLGDLIRDLGDDDDDDLGGAVEEAEEEEEEEEDAAAAPEADEPAAAARPKARRPGTARGGSRRPAAAQGHKTTKQFLDEFLRAAGELEVSFEPIGKHDSYRFGTRVVILKVVRDRLLVRVGGGFSTIEDFVAQNTAAESKKLQQQLERAGAKQRRDQGTGYGVQRVKAARREKRQRRRGTLLHNSRVPLY